MRRLPFGSHLKCFTTLVTYTSPRAMPAASTARSRMRPAGPTNGLPARSSSLPGCSMNRQRRARESHHGWNLRPPGGYDTPTVRLGRRRPRHRGGTFELIGGQSKRDAAESNGEQRAGGCNDRIGIDAVVPEQIYPRPGLTEVLDAERLLRYAEGSADEAKRVGMTVEDGHDRDVFLVGGHEALQPRPRRTKTALQTVGTRDDEDVRKRTVGAERARRLERLWHHGAGGEQLHGAIARVPAGLAR